MKKAEQFGVRAAKMSQEGQIVDGDGKVSLIDIKDGLVLVILCHPDLTRNARKQYIFYGCILYSICTL